MKTFKNFLNEEILLEELEELLNEAKDDNTKVGGASNNTKGVLHELLTGYHLQGGKHMEKHHLISDKGKRETPQQAHDRLKSQIHPEDYKKINDRAKSAASDIKKEIQKTHPGHVIDHVHHTSKPGDTEKETGVKASQKEDSSDIYITSKHPKTGKTAIHGRSLKVSQNSSKNVPSSNLGKESAGLKADNLHKEHKEKILKDHPTLSKVKKGPEHDSIEDARKEWAKNNPKKHEAIKVQNRKLLHNVAHHHAAELQHNLDSGNHEKVVNHIRDVLGSHKTPAEKAGKADFRKHTTYVTSKGIQHHSSHPGEEHEHILKDHKNITVKASGGSVHFSHTDPKTGVTKKFATQSHKFKSQSDPLGTLSSSGKAT
jgi:hypothetical protein